MKLYFFLIHYSLSRVGNVGFNVNNQDKLFSSIPSYRKGWVDSFMKTANGDNFKFNSNIGSTPSRPIGTDFEGTSYAYRYKNSLFIVVDVFRTIDNENGAENYIDRENGYGGEGAITCTMDNDHILWFESVLKAARSDESIKHIFVEAHVPIQHPVRKVNCSGQFLDDQAKSQLWKLMEEYNVDIYFAGEVHATTVTMSKTVGSSLLQIVSRGNKMHGFLSAATTDDTIVVKHFKDVGPGPKYNNNYSESGSLIIDKSNPSDTKISANGDLAILNDSAALIHFDFEAKYKMSERQIEGLYSDKMIPEKIVVGRKKCNKSIHNVGTFGQQYDSQVKEVALVQGRHNNTSAGKFRARSRMAVFSMGPYTAGMVNSISFWMKTSQAKREMVLLYFGPNRDITEKNTLRFILKNGQLNFRFSRSSTNFRLIQEKMLADNEWHHIAMSMPFDSCKYSDVDLYIDGAPYEFEQTVGEDNHIFFHTEGRLNIGSYGYAKDSNADDLLSHFVGQLDDIMIWSHALKATDVLQLSCQNNKTFRFKFSNGSKKKCVFLNKNENRRRNYCQDKSVAMNCPKACHLCD